MCRNTHPLFLGTDYDTPTLYISRQQKMASVNDGFSYFNDIRKNIREK